MIVWPATLPTSPVPEGMNETLGDNTIRTNMDSGPGKIRAKGTDEPDKFNVTYQMTKTETSYLETFYKVTLSYGALPFQGYHPRTGVLSSTERYRFLTPPAFSCVGGDTWQCSFGLELLPNE